jgi:hypothetical protein
MSAEIAGLAGVPAPQVLSIQGVPGGVPIATTGGGGGGGNASVGLNGVAAPASSTQIGGPDAGGLLEAAAVRTAAPTGAEEGLVVRNIPSGVQQVVEAASTATAVALVAGTVVLTTLLVANASRKGATFYNEGNRPWFIKLGAGASTASYTVQVQKDAYFEVPYHYTGIITGLQAVANGNLLVTELT